MRAALIGLSIALSGAAAGTALAQIQTERAVEQYTCKDIMREAGSDREVAVAFLHGFLLGKTGNSKFNVEVLAKQTDTFLEKCLDSPTEKAMDVMLKIKG